MERGQSSSEFHTDIGRKLNEMLSEMRNAAEPRFKSPEDNPAGAYLYVFGNPAFPRLLKIGFTERSPKERATELSSSTGVPGEFYVERDWFVPADRVRELERDIHRELRHLGHHHWKEFFSIDVPNAASVIETILDRHNLLEFARADEQERRLILLQAQQEAAKQAREREIAKELERFRVSLETRLAERHKLRFQTLPHFPATAAAVLVLIYALYSREPWLLILTFGAYIIVYGALASRDLEFVRQRYGSLIEERVHKARSLIEGSELTPEEVISTDECKQLLEVAPEALHPRHSALYRRRHN